MLNKKMLASDAIVKALQVRKMLNLTYEESVSAIDAAQQLGIEVRLTDLPSMEGMYVTGKNPTIILSCLRPQGRRNFTCAHEMGHHIMGHGEQFDELVKEKSVTRSKNPIEFQADCFAAFFLMPKVTIENGLKRRGFSYETLDSMQTFELSTWLGVGYSTLVNHLLYGLEKISRIKATELLRSKPYDIRKQLLTIDSPHLVLTNEFWLGRAIDCETADCIVLPNGSHIEGLNRFHVVEGQDAFVVRAALPGLARVTKENWSSYIRISPALYTGRACYRFEEEVDE